MDNKIIIVLEKGEAKKPFTEMTHEEFREAGERIFKKVIARAAAFGHEPAVGVKKKIGNDESGEVCPES